MQHLQTAWNSQIKYTASSEYFQISKYMYEVTLLPMLSVALWDYSTAVQGHWERSSALQSKHKTNILQKSVKYLFFKYAAVGLQCLLKYS